MDARVAERSGGGRECLWCGELESHKAYVPIQSLQAESSYTLVSSDSERAGCVSGQQMEAVG